MLVFWHLGGYIAFVDSDDYISSDYLEYLYCLLKETKSDMSICSHQHMNLGGDPVEAFDVGEDFVLSPEIFFEKMFYGELKGIGVSIHARLIRRDLFDGVVFPEGKLFEDSAVSYLNVLHSQQIAITYKPKYCYVRNQDSIVQKEFDKSRLDFIVAEEQMVNAVTQVYPQVKSAGLRRIMYAYLNTLAHMVLVNKPEFKSLELQLKNKILKHYYTEIRDARVPKKDKLAMCLLKYGGLPTYRFAFRMFKKKQIG